MWDWRNRAKSEAEPEAGAAKVRALLRESAASPREPSAFFAKRVMAAIEAQENEFARRTRAWAAVPAFASRLSAIAALLLIAAGTWLYSGYNKQSVLVNGIFEDSAAQAASTSQDEVFTLPGEEVR